MEQRGDSTGHSDILPAQRVPAVAGIAGVPLTLSSCQRSLCAPEAQGHSLPALPTSSRAQGLLPRPPQAHILRSTVWLPADAPGGAGRGSPGAGTEVGITMERAKPSPGEPRCQVGVDRRFWRPLCSLQTLLWGSAGKLQERAPFRAPCQGRTETRKMPSWCPHPARRTLTLEAELNRLHWVLV